MFMAELRICTPGEAWLQTSSREVSRADHWPGQPAAHLAGRELQIHPKTTLHEQETQGPSKAAAHANASFRVKTGTNSASCWKRLRCTEATDVWHQKASKSQVKLNLWLSSMSPKAFTVAKSLPHALQDAPSSQMDMSYFSVALC